MLNTKTQICLDRGGSLVTLDYLRRLHDPAHGGTPPKPMGSRHHPVPFYQLADLVISRVERLYTGPGGQFQVEDMHLALNDKQTQVFGLLIIRKKEPVAPVRTILETDASWSNRMAAFREKLANWRDKPTGWMIGFRGSINQSISEAMVVGLKVFLCENLCISGGANSIFICQKNTKNGLDNLRNKVTLALHDAERIVGAIQHDLDIFRTIPFSISQMAELTGKAQYNGVVTSQQANEVYRQIRAASLSDDERREKEITSHFTGRTLWDAYNHLTEGVKLGRIDNTFEKHARVHDFCKEIADDMKPTPRLLAA
jgi:hypothetical protein